MRERGDKRLGLRVAGPLAAVVVCALALSAGGEAGAQPAAGAMPDLRTMNGRPLPVAELAAGTVTVRVARKVPANSVANLDVTAMIVTGKNETRKKVKTAADGRATFSEIPAGSQFKAEITVDGERLESQVFTIAAEGGTRLMLIAGLGGPQEPNAVPAGGHGTEGSGGKAQAGQSAEGAPGEDEQAFSRMAMTGLVAGKDGSPAGTLELVVLDEAGKPLPGRVVRLGQVGASQKLIGRSATTDTEGRARFSNLPTGETFVYAAIVEHQGMRVGAQPFRMEATRGMAGEIRALGRTSNPSVLTLHSQSRFIFEPREDALAVWQSLVISNSGTAIFEPGPGGLELPLPDNFQGATEMGGGAPVEVRQKVGMLLRQPIPPNSAAMAATAARFAFSLPADGASEVTLQQPMPFGITTPLLLVPQKAGLTLSGSGIKRLPDEKNGDGELVQLYEGPTVDRGGVLTLTIAGLAARNHGARNAVGALAVLLMLAAAVLGRSPKKAGGSGAGLDELVQRREDLFADLVELERRQRRPGGAATGANYAKDRRELVGKLEAIYQSLAEREATPGQRPLESAAS